MKKLSMILALLLATTSAFAVDDILKNDKVKLGKPTNPATDKTIEFNKGSGALNPKIKLNGSTGRLQFTNNGTNFSNLGSGSGGGGGINLIAENNPGFEEGTAQWTNSGGGATFTTSGTTPGYELLSGVFNSSAASQTLSSTAVSIPSGLQGTPCVGSFWYKTAESTNKYKVQVYDGTNVLSESTLEATGTAWDKFNGYTGFTCPSSGTILVRIISTGDAADISVDQGMLGEQKTVLVDRNGFYGKVRTPWTASCGWSGTGFTTPGTYSAVAACPVATATGSVEAPATKIPAVRLRNLPEGTYRFEARGVLYAGSVNGSCTFSFTDGTNVFGKGIAARDSFSEQNGSVLGEVTYSTSQSDITVQLRVIASNASTNCQVFNDAAVFENFEISVYRYPVSSQVGIRADQTGWRVDANISGANPSLGTAAVTSYTGIENGSLTLVNNPGSGVLAAQIPCSSTNAPTGTTCAAGNESVGVSVPIPYEGDVQACVSFSSFAQCSSGGSCNSVFQVVETPSNSQTILQEGKTRITGGVGTSVAGSPNGFFPMRVCGTFPIASSGLKTFRLMYEQGGSFSASTIQGDANPVYGQWDIHWEVYPLNRSSNIPVVFKGMVTSNSAGRERTERFTVETLCSASPCTISSQSGSWVSSVTRSGVGQYAFNIIPGTFSAVPTCVCTNYSGNTRGCTIGSLTTSGANISIFLNPSTAEDGRWGMLCQGPN